MESENTQRTIEYIKERLKHVMSNTLFKMDLPDDTKYPIEFENETGKWRIESDGSAIVQPHQTLKHVDININLQK